MSALIEVKTAGGIVAELNPSITYEQSRSLMTVYIEEGLTKVQIMDKADKLGIEYVVASLNGTKEDIHKRFRNLPLADAREIVEVMKTILDPKAPAPASK